jgi:hypothetical protein
MTHLPHVRSTHHGSEPGTPDRLVRKIVTEFAEMPGLRLTQRQAQRLWGLDSDACTGLLDRLVSSGAISCGSDGRYQRSTAAESRDDALRMAKAALRDSTSRHALEEHAKTAPPRQHRH